MRVYEPSLVLDRHIHDAACAAIVVTGAFEEAGERGRFRVEAGDVLLHDRFEAHLDRFSRAGAVVLDLPLPPGRSFRPGIAKLADPDVIVITAERSPAEAAVLLLSKIQHATASFIDWPDELAAALMQDSSLVLCSWAQQQGIAPWTVTRGFAKVFGVSPEAFRARARTRRAWEAIQNTRTPLPAVALDCGFSDQAHMTRGVKRMTKMTPGEWRTLANGFKTA